MSRQVGRHSASVTMLPGSPWRSQLSVGSGDDERGSLYTTKSLSSIQRTNKSLRPPYRAGRMKPSYLDDIEVGLCV